LVDEVTAFSLPFLTFLFEFQLEVGSFLVLRSDLWLNGGMVLSRRSFLKVTFVSVDPNQLSGIDELLITTVNGREFSLFDVLRDGSARLPSYAVDL
jgi:hypothetical protein